MAIKSGLAAQFGMKAESTYGTPVTVDRFYEIDSESIVPDFEIIRSRGLGIGRVLRTDRSKRYARGYSGQVVITITNKDFGLWFEHCLGQNTISGASANKTHTCILDAAALQGKSLTVQVGRPGVDGTVRAFTYEGGKVLDWEIGLEAGQPAKLTVNMWFENLLTNTALASASYTATREMFIWSEGAVSVGGSTFYAKSMKIRGDNKLNTDRRFIGNTKKEPLASDFTEITGEIEAEFEDLTQYAAFEAGTQQAIQLALTLATVIPTTAVAYSLTIAMPKCEWEEAKPTVGGPDIVGLVLPFRGLYDGTNAAITITYVTADTAA